MQECFSQPFLKIATNDLFTRQGLQTLDRIPESGGGDGAQQDDSSCMESSERQLRPLVRSMRHSGCREITDSARKRKRHCSTSLH